MREKIKATMQMDVAHSGDLELVLSPYRANLTLQVVGFTKLHSDLNFLKHISRGEGLIIVYANAVKDAYHIKKMLEKAVQTETSPRVAVYHKKAYESKRKVNQQTYETTKVSLTDHEREQIEEAVKGREIDILVSTVAFGLGIDIPHVRQVIVVNSRSLASVMQQWGRAGRDGSPAKCMLFYSRKDFLPRSNSSADDIKRQEQLKRFVQNDESVCRWASICKYFGAGRGELPAAGCGKCDVCVTPLRHENFAREVRFVLGVLQQAGATSQATAQSFNKLWRLVTEEGTILNDEWKQQSNVLRITKGEITGQTHQWKLKAFLEFLTVNVQPKFVESHVVQPPTYQAYECAHH